MLRVECFCMYFTEDVFFIIFRDLCMPRVQLQVTLRAVYHINVLKTMFKHIHARSHYESQYPLMVVIQCHYNVKDLEAAASNCHNWKALRCKVTCQIKTAEFATTLDLS